MEENKKTFGAELLGRVINFLDPQKTAVILICAVLMGLVGFGFGELFLKKEYRAQMTLAVNPKTAGNHSTNLTDAHHIADVLGALYDNDEVVKKAIEDSKINRTVSQFVNKLSVQRESKTVLVKIKYTDYSAQSAVDGINDYQKALCNAITENLGHKSFTVLYSSDTPDLIDHTPTAILIAILIELIIAASIVVIRVYPGIIIITGTDLTEFKEPVLGEVFTVPNLFDDEETEGGNEQELSE